MTAIAKLAYKRGSYGYALFEDWQTASPSIAATSGRPAQVATGFALRSESERPGGR